MHNMMIWKNRVCFRLFYLLQRCLTWITAFCSPAYYAQKHWLEKKPLAKLRTGFNPSFSAVVLFFMALFVHGMSYAAPATYSLPANIGTSPFNSCSLTSGTTYTCTSDVSIGNNDTINVTSAMTLKISGDLKVGNNSTINNGGNEFTIIATQEIEIGNSFTGSVNLQSTGDKIQIGNSVNITGNVSAATVLEVGTGTINGICTYSTTNFICTSTPTVSIAAASVTEGNSGTKTLTFTVSLSASSSSTVTVNYATSNGTATTADSDYVAASGTLTFTAGQTSKTFTVTINGDTKYEVDETFTVTLSSPSNATLGTSTATGTIINDDASPAITIANASLTEGNSGSSSMSFTVSLNAVSGLQTTVSYALSDGSATGGASCSGSTDYVITNGTISIAAGIASGVILVSVCGDTAVESNETLTVTLSNPGNATLGSSTGTGTIINDDTALSSFNGCEASSPHCIPAAALGYAALYTKLASTAFGLEGVALKADGTLENSFSGSVTVDLLANSNTGVALGANNCPTSQNATISLGNAVFSAGRASISNINVANAYRDVRMRFTCALGVCGSAITVCSSDNFAVRPGAATLMTSANAAVPSATATPVIKAGTAFTIGATTTTSAGYTGTLALDTAKLTAQLPSNGSTPLSGGAVGTLTVSPAVQANAAPSQSNNATWTEVGYLYAAAGAFRDDGFTSVDQAGGDCVSSTTNDVYLADTFDANNKIGCSIGNKTAVSFGRFVPDHFTVVGTIANACAAGAFTYMGQSFALSQANVVEARNAANGVTQNYAGSYAHGSVSFGAENADNGTDLSSRLTFSSGSWTLGAYTLASTSGTFSRPSTTVSDATWGAFESLDIGLTVNDTDVTTSPQVSGADMNPSVAGGSSLAYKKFSGSPMPMRLGRLNLQNTYGSELLGLPMPLTAEYWNGSSWISNTADSCTALTAPASGSGLTLNLASTGSTTATLSNPLASGDAGLSLTAPGVTHTGYVDVTINSPSWLKFNWKGAGDTDPTARATFGIYKGNSKFIYIRELY